MLEPALKGLQHRLLLDQDQAVLLVLSAKDLVQEIAIFVPVLNIFFSFSLFLPIWLIKWHLGCPPEVIIVVENSSYCRRNCRRSTAGSCKKCGGGGGKFTSGKWFSNLERSIQSNIFSNKIQSFSCHFITCTKYFTAYKRLFGRYHSSGKQVFRETLRTQYLPMQLFEVFT